MTDERLRQFERRGKATGDGSVFLRVHGHDGEPVRSVDFDGESDLSKEEVKRRVLETLLDAALAAGLDADAIRSAVRDDLGTWALRERPESRRSAQLP